MSPWRSCQIGDLCNIQHGYAFKGEYFSDSGPYVLLTPGNFREEGGLKLKGDKEKYYKGEFPDEYLLRRGDLLLAMTDLTQNAPILGSPAFVPADDRYLHNQRLGKVIDVDPIEVNVEYLYYLFCLPSVREHIKGSATGSTVRHTSPSRIANVPVQIPPITTQNCIAGILSAYDELIANSQHRIQILESMARALYREWFVNFRFPGHEKVRRVPSEMGEIPEGWRVGKLSDIAEEMRRNVSKGEIGDSQFYVGLEHIPRRSLALDTWVEIAELGSNKLRFMKGEVLFGKIRPYFHKVSIAPFDGLCSADTIVIRAKERHQSGLVSALVSSDEFVSHATATSNGSKMPRANWSVLRNYDVSVPPVPLARRFSDIFTDLTSLQQHLVATVHNLRCMRDLLLPRLLSGRIVDWETSK